MLQDMFKDKPDMLAAYDGGGAGGKGGKGRRASASLPTTLPKLDPATHSCLSARRTSRCHPSRESNQLDITKSVVCLLWQERRRPRRRRWWIWRQRQFRLEGEVERLAHWSVRQHERACERRRRHLHLFVHPVCWCALPLHGALPLPGRSANLTTMKEHSSKHVIDASIAALRNVTFVAALRPKALPPLGSLGVAHALGSPEPCPAHAAQPSSRVHYLRPAPHTRPCPCLLCCVAV